MASLGLPFPSGPSALATDGVYLAASAPNEPAVYLRVLEDGVATSSSKNHRECTLRCPASPSNRPFSSLLLSHHHLFAASRDTCVTWNVQEVFQALNYGERLPEPIALCTPPGSVAQLAASSDGKYLAVASLDLTMVIDLASKSTAFQLEGHTGLITSVVFLPNSSLLVTAGEDRTFRVWDLGAGALLYRSPILCAYPLVHLAVDDSIHPRLAVASSDGLIRVFDVSKPAAVTTCLTTLDLGKVAEKLTNGPDRESSSSNPGTPIKLIVDPIRRLNLNDGGGSGNLAGAFGEGAGSRPKWDPSISTIPAVPSTLQDLRSLSTGGNPTPTFANWSGGGALNVSSHFLADEASVASLPGLSIVPITLAFCPPLQTASSPSASSPLFKAASQLLVLLPTSLISFDGRTYEPRLVSSAPAETPYRTGAAGYTSTSTVCLAAHSFSPVVSSLLSGSSASGSLVTPKASNGPVRIIDGRGGSAPAAPAPTPSTSSSDTAADLQPLSIFLRAPLPETSPLWAALNKQTVTGDGRARSVSLASSSSSRAGPSSSSSTASKRPLGPSASSKNVVQDKPVTFHSRIKSSGYGSYAAAPLRIGQPAPPLKKVSTAIHGKGNANAQALTRSYPVDGPAPTEFQAKNVLPDKRPWHNGAVLGVAYSQDGTRLMTWSADRSARTWKIPIARHAGEGTDLLGHSSAVTWGSFSVSSNLLLTSSLDRTARLWAQGKAEPLLFLDRVRRSPKATGVDPEPNPSFTAEVVGARFMYLDRLIVLGHQSKVHVYQYSVNSMEESRNDIERLKRNNKYKEVTSLRSEAQTITAIAAANSFLSPLVLASGSDRSIVVFDLAANKIARTVPDSHERAAHFIALLEPSPFTNHAQESYEVFGTSSVDNTIKLWDLRTGGKCVSRLGGGHSCRQTPSSFAFSPCLRYLATGSEDKSLVLYDLRTNTVLERLRSPTGDAVTGAAFHPLHPQVAAASVDGRVRFFAAGGSGGGE